MKETYCDVLSKYKLDLEKPYDEASKFLTNMESQLSNLCNNIPRMLGYFLSFTLSLILLKTYYYMLCFSRKMNRVVKIVFIGFCAYGFFKISLSCILIRAHIG